MTKHVILPDDPEALAREGLQEIPQVWEDGLRTEPGSGNFEWWYFDAHFEDGSTAVVSFFTKPLLDRRAPLKPGLSIAITRPDGQKRNGLALSLPLDFSASPERCEVKMGVSFLRGDLINYELHARAGELAVQLNITSLVPAWRPGTGKNYFDAALRRYFAWLPAIPYGSAEGSLTYDGQTHAVKGNCYHDHNWGNVGLNEVLTHWYWGRAHLNDYTLIFAEMYASEAYGRQKIPVFFLARGSQILTGDGGPLQLKEQDMLADPGGRSYPDGLELSWQKEDLRIQLALRRPTLIDKFSLLDFLPAWQRAIGRIIANPYYFRFNAELDLQIDSAGIKSREQGLAIYELMLLK
jgi:hypothetical protein